MQECQVVRTMRFADQSPPFLRPQKYDLARPHIAIFDITMLLEPISPALGAHSTGFKLLPALNIFKTVLSTWQFRQT
jgi:hypothetical protein